MQKPPHTPASPVTAKDCAACGRTIEWRRKWARDWDNVRYCSDGCKGRKLAAVDHALEKAILHLLEARGRDKTICPSEAARAVAGEKAELWQPRMEQARAAARRLVSAGKVVITQNGRIVDASTAKGPIRVRLR